MRFFSALFKKGETNCKTAQTNPELFPAETEWQWLVDRLVKEQRIHSNAIEAAFRAYPRSFFVPARIASLVNKEDRPFEIDSYQTISRPSTVATMLHSVDPKKGDEVLDVGTGSAWHATLLSHCVGPEGRVVTVERKKKLYKQAQERIETLRLQNVELLYGDACDERLLPGQTFNVISSAAAAQCNVPKPLLDRLKDEGRLIHPIEKPSVLRVVKKTRGAIKQHDLPFYRFVPLLEGVVED